MKLNQVGNNKRIIIWNGPGNQSKHEIMNLHQTSTSELMTPYTTLCHYFCKFNVILAHSMGAAIKNYFHNMQSIFSLDQQSEYIRLFFEVT